MGYSRCGRRPTSFFTDLLAEFWSFGESSTQRVEEIVVALPGLRSRGCLGGLRKLRRRPQPETDEHRNHLDRDVDVTFDPLQSSVDAVEPLRDGSFTTFVSIG